MKSFSREKRIKLNKDELIIAITTLLLIAYFAILPLRSSSARHVVVFVGSIFYYILALRRIMTVKKSFVFFVQFMLLVCVILFDILITVKQYNYEVFYSALNLLSLFILLSSKNTVRFTKRAFNWLFWGTLVLSGMAVLLSYSSVAYFFEDGRKNGFLVLGMTNPNVTGLMLSGLVNILLIFYAGKGKTIKFVLLIVIALLMNLLVRTGCRSAIICSVLVICYALFFKEKRFPWWFVLVPIIISILFVPTYLSFSSARTQMITVLGKPLFSGRDFVYRENLALLTNNFYWLFGNYGMAKLSNAHNAPLCILCSFGLVGTSVVYWNYGKRLIQINVNASSYYSRMCIACLMSLFIQSSMEAVMLTGVFPSIAIIYFFTLFADQNEKGIIEIIGKEQSYETENEHSGA